MIDAPRFQKLRQPPTPEQQDAKLRQVGDLYEKQFLREMVKAMRSTVHEGGFIKSNQAEQIFKEQLDQEYVEKWGAKGGIGLSDMIHKQLLEKYGAQLGIRPPIQRPHGPLPLDQKSNISAKPVQVPTTGDLQKLTFEYFKDDDSNSKATEEVSNPWSGKILGQYRLEQGDNLIQILHDNGLRSALAFKGTAKVFQGGETLAAGDKVGLLSPDAKALYWTVDKAPTKVGNANE